MTDPFTLREGRLELDENQGKQDGPRVIDPVAGLVRFADESKNIPFAELRAVAIVYTQRMVSRHVGRSYQLVPTLVHSVMLVPRRLGADVAALLDALETGADPGPGFSIRGAAMMVDDASIQFDLAGSGLVARRTAKAIARLMRLPVVELYGEFYVWRAADKLDQTLRERLRGAPPRADPGPAPPELWARPGANGLEIRVMRRPRPLKPWLFVVAAGVALSVGLAFVDLVLAVGAFLLSVATLVLGLRGRNPPTSELRIEPDAIRWLHETQGGSLAKERLEMMRVNDAMLVLISHDDELRCDLGTEAAAQWARRAIEHALLAPSAGAYR